MSTPAPDAPPRVPPGPVLAVAVLAISGAALLVRLAPEVPAVSAALWRVGAVGALLAPSLLPARARLGLSPGRVALGALAGLLLALHFWAWFESLHRTTVLRSTLLVCLTPLWTGLMEWLILRRAPGRRTLAGVALALLGVALMNSGASAGPAGAEASVAGDLLAVVGGVLSAAYLFVGKVLRPHLSLAPYGALVFLSCGLWLLPIALLLGAPLSGWPGSAWGALALMALGPQLVGHLGLSYGVRYVPAVIVSALILLEPVGAAVLGAAFLGEQPSGVELIGGGVVLAGVAGATWPGAAR